MYNDTREGFDAGIHQFRYVLITAEAVLDEARELLSWWTSGTVATPRVTGWSLPGDIAFAVLFICGVKISASAFAGSCARSAAACSTAQRAGWRALCRRRLLANLPPRPRIESQRYRPRLAKIGHQEWPGSFLSP
jgi:hypothetical protein